MVLITDGLGHGFGAAEAAQEAIATFKKRSDLGPGEILSYMHDALRKTRGAVAAIAEIRPKDKRSGVCRSGKYLWRCCWPATDSRKSCCRTTERWA